MAVTDASMHALSFSPHLYYSEKRRTVRGYRVRLEKDFHELLSDEGTGSRGRTRGKNMVAEKKRQVGE